MNQADATSEESVVPQQVLVIDDEATIAESCSRALSRQGHHVRACSDSEEGLAQALTGKYDVLFLDLMMPKVTGLDILNQMRAAGVSTEVIIMTAYSTVESAVEVMKAGAADYLSKPFSPPELLMVLEKVASRSAMMREIASLRHELGVQKGFEGIVGESPMMQKVFALIKRVAPTDATVLITGESGTGKEVIVSALHRLSKRGARGLLACDCSTLAPTLLESELFGHVKGSFSGAISTKPGLFEAADKGTLFLDEVANISMETQGKLLRVLESRRVKKVGDTSESEVNIRLIAATNRSLAEMVAEGEFREDLFYRLNVVPINLPPLRRRQGDIPILVAHFLNQFVERSMTQVRSFTPEAMQHMESYRWPGNVRELRNIVERIAVLCDSDRVELRHLPREIRQTGSVATVTTLPEAWEDFKQLKQEIRESAVRDLEIRYLNEALARAGGKVTKAAENVGMRRTNFHSLMKKYGLHAAKGEE
jgi:DNA-binding NtrC family response regulator